VARRSSAAARPPPTDDDLASFQGERRFFVALCWVPPFLAALPALLGPWLFEAKFARSCWTGGFFALPLSFYFVVWGVALHGRGRWARQRTRPVVAATLVASAPLWFVPFLLWVMVTSR
jgi:hypothetical protein